MRWSCGNTEKPETRLQLPAACAIFNTMNRKWANKLSRHAFDGTTSGSIPVSALFQQLASPYPTMRLFEYESNDDPPRNISEDGSGLFIFSLDGPRFEKDENILPVSFVPLIVKERKKK